ncbi:copper homeostasis CutC domain-containing protein, partial [Rhodofomes roseus]
SRLQVELEVCIDSVESAVAAVAGGADRLELCGSLTAGGGVTPSLGMFKAVARAAPQVPILVMIRPRTGDFVYSDEELEVMIEDIRIFKLAGAAGVVFGVLTREGEIDVGCGTRWVGTPLLPSVFTGRNNISSGQEPTCTTSTALANISTLFRVLNDNDSQHQPHMASRFNILPGSGVSPNTIRSVLLELLPLGLCQIHMSGGQWIPSEARYRKEGMGMGVGEGQWAVWRTNEEHVREVVRIIMSTGHEWLEGN